MSILCAFFNWSTQLIQKVIDHFDHENSIFVCGYRIVRDDQYVSLYNPGGLFSHRIRRLRGDAQARGLLDDISRVGKQVITFNEMMILFGAGFVTAEQLKAMDRRSGVIYGIKYKDTYYDLRVALPRRTSPSYPKTATSGA